MSSAPTGVVASDFTIITTGGVAPTIQNVIPNGLDAILIFDNSIPAGQWTQITYNPSNGSLCLGYLPADVSNDGTSASGDILWVIDCLNGTRTCEIWQCDADRSDLCASADILRVIDVLNGAGVYDVWLGASLPDNPCLAGGESASRGGGALVMSDGSASEGDFVDGFETLLTSGDWSDFSSRDLRVTVMAMTDWVVLHVPASERFALAERLQDPSLTFSNAVISEIIPDIVTSLLHSR